MGVFAYLNQWRKNPLGESLVHERVKHLDTRLAKLVIDMALAGIRQQSICTRYLIESLTRASIFVWMMAQCEFVIRTFDLAGSRLRRQAEHTIGFFSGFFSGQHAALHRLASVDARENRDAQLGGGAVRTASVQVVASESDRPNGASS